MNIRYEARFKKDLQNIRNKDLLNKVKKVIDDVKKADDLRQLSQLKKLQGFANYFRFKIGDYRIGIEIEDGNVVFVRFLHRREVYRFFP